MSSNTSDNEVFEYTGNGQSVPKNVVRVRFHSSVIEVPVGAFLSCKKLRGVVLNEGLQTVGMRAFAHCKSLERISFPSTVTDIGYLAFCDCTGLKEVVLNEGLKKIGNFACCSSLESITLPSTLIEISNAAFQSCGELSKVMLNEGLVKISMQAFESCKSLKSITIPSTVTEIGVLAFFACSNLREVVCIEGLPNVSFASCHELERITFPNLSSRLEDIIRAGQLDIQNKIQQHINRGGIEWRRGSTIYIPTSVTRNNDMWKELKHRVDQVVKWIKYYELKEATTIFELALWKAKIDQEEEEHNTLDRDECRVDVPGPVKDAIMQYLI